MKNCSLIMFISLLSIVFSMNIEVSSGANIPLFSLSKMVNTGYGFSLQLPITKNDFSHNYFIDFSYNIFSSRYHEDVKLHIISLGLGIDYSFLQSFKSNLSCFAIFNVISEEIRKGDSNQGDIFACITLGGKYEYFYTDMLHLTLSTGLTVTDQIYFLFLKGGILIKI